MNRYSLIKEHFPNWSSEDINHLMKSLGSTPDTELDDVLKTCRKVYDIYGMFWIEVRSSPLSVVIRP